MKSIVTFTVVLLQAHFSFATVVPLPAPVRPNYATCKSDDYACREMNTAMETQYNNDLNAYNDNQRAIAAENANQAVAAATAQSSAVTAAATTSASAQLQQAQDQNKNGSSVYSMASTGCAVASAGFAVAYMMSCPIPCNAALLKASIAFAAFSLLASMQAKSHDKVAYSACQSQNQISSSQQNCGVDPSTTAAPTYPPANLTATGTSTTTTNPFQPGTSTCIPGNETLCQSFADATKDLNNPGGTSLYDRWKAGQSAFANGSSKTDKLFKVNPDGSIITKDGKKYNLSDFADEKSMIAAGFTPQEASSLTASNRMGANALNAKSALASENGLNGSGASTGGSAFGDGAGGTVKVSDGALNGDNKDGKDKLLGTSGKGNGDRRPSSADGLTRDFNGELIGVAGDDIFKMMNRRYNLKASQDSFIGQ